MSKAVLYIHGKGGNAREAKHYEPLFPGGDVVGFDYAAQTPWEARLEFPGFYDNICAKHESVTIIANSIGAFFAMSSLYDKQMENAFFISPIVDMEKLISDMMGWANVSEEELRARKKLTRHLGKHFRGNICVMCGNIQSFGQFRPIFCMAKMTT